MGYLRENSLLRDMQDMCLPGGICPLPIFFAAPPPSKVLETGIISNLTIKQHKNGIKKNHSSICSLLSYPFEPIKELMLHAGATTKQMLTWKKTLPLLISFSNSDLSDHFENKLPRYGQAKLLICTQNY